MPARVTVTYLRALVATANALAALEIGNEPNPEDIGQFVDAARTAAYEAERYV